MTGSVESNRPLFVPPFVEVVSVLSAADIDVAVELWQLWAWAAPSASCLRFCLARGFTGLGGIEELGALDALCDLSFLPFTLLRKTRWRLSPPRGQMPLDCWRPPGSGRGPPSPPCAPLTPHPLPHLHFLPRPHPPLTLKPFLSIILYMHLYIVHLYPLYTVDKFRFLS